MIEFARRRKNHHHINITPLVDVVFLLLLFFMLSSRFVSAPTIKIALPDSKTSQPEVQEEVIVTVAKDGDLFIDQTPVTLAELQAGLEEKLAQLKKPAVRIKADREAMLGLIVNVVDEVRLAGAGAFSIETERKER
jgi:biopolymer transport protein ExbD